jgi:NitT/TauT family transport system permease protein
MANMEDARRRSAEELTDAGLKIGIRRSCVRIERWLPLGIILAGLVGWEWQARTGGLSPLFFPAPFSILKTFFRLLIQGILPTHIAATLGPALLGLVLGGLPGLILGLAMGWSQRLREVMEPFIASGHPMPKIALLPLIMIIFGIGETSKVVVIAIAAFFPMLINTMAGVRQINPTYFEVAVNYGASLSKMFTRVILPGSLPAILVGVRLAFNIAMLLTIAVEMVISQAGLGGMIWFAWQTLRTEELYASLVAIAALGVGFNVLLMRATARLVPWQVERES